MSFEKSLKDLLKKLKLSEPTISTILGGLVIVVVGILIFKYFRSQPSVEPLVSTSEEEITEATQAGEVTVVEKETETGEKKLVKIYKVQKGDYLWQVAEKAYQDGYQWPKIAELNNLANPDYLEVGQELTLPDIEPALAGDEPTQDQTVQAEAGQTIPGDKYLVQEGDSLWDISVRAYGDGYKWPQVSQVNNLANPDYLEVGQELKLPR